MSRQRGTGSLFRKTYNRDGRPVQRANVDHSVLRQRTARTRSDRAAGQASGPACIKRQLGKVALNEYRRTEPIRCEALFAALHMKYLNDRREETAARLAWQWKQHSAPCSPTYSPTYWIATQLRVTWGIAGRKAQPTQPSTVNWLPCDACLT